MPAIGSHLVPALPVLTRPLRFGHVDHAQPKPAAPGPEMTSHTLRQVVKRIEYKGGYYFVAQGNRADNMTVQVQFDAPDASIPNSPPTRRTGARKWPIQPDYSPFQVAQTLLMALKAVEEHETRESFHYKGRKVENPHFDLAKMSVFLRMQQPEPGKTSRSDSSRNDSIADVQNVLNDCNYRGYGFEMTSMGIAEDDRINMVVKFNKHPKIVGEFHEYLGKKISFVTGRSNTRIVRNLFNAIWHEQLKEINDKYKFDGFATYGNDIPIEALVEFDRLQHPDFQLPE